MRDDSFAQLMAHVVILLDLMEQMSDIIAELAIRCKPEAMVPAGRIGDELRTLRMAIEKIMESER